MNSPVFRLRVDRAENGQFVWVIAEVDPASQDFELVASLRTFPTPAQAMAEGAKVLEQLRDG